MNKQKRQPLDPMGVPNKNGDKRGMHTRFNDKIAKSIYKLYEDGHIVKDICKQLSICPDTFYTWKKTKPKFSDKLKEIKENRENNRFELAMKGIESRLEWRDVIETEATYKVIQVKDKKTKLLVNKSILEKVIERKKKVAPSDAMLIFTAVNLDPERKLKSVNAASQTDTVRSNEDITVTVTAPDFSQ